VTAPPRRRRRAPRLKKTTRAAMCFLFTDGAVQLSPHLLERDLPISPRISPRLLARGVLQPQPLLLRRQRLRAQPAILEVVVRLVSQTGGRLSPMSPRISHSRSSCA